MRHCIAHVVFARRRRTMTMIIQFAAAAAGCCAMLDDHHMLTFDGVRDLVKVKRFFSRILKIN